MASIAVIDDNINSKLLMNEPVVKCFQIRGGKRVNMPETLAAGWTHATVIAAILEHCTENFEIINIQIFHHDSPESMYLELVEIESLKTAIELCIELDVDIISMSLGSTQLLDAPVLKEAVKRAADHGCTMIAALSNGKRLTVPAAYPEVIGVQCDRENRLQPGEFVYDAGDLLKAEVTANCSFKRLMNNIEDYQLCNSYAVPVVTAKINDLWNRGIHSLNEIRKELQKESAAGKALLIAEEHRRGLLTGEIPHICIVGNGILTRDFYMEIFNTVATDKCCAAAGLTDDRAIEDVRIFQWRRIHASLRDALTFIERCSNTDIILSYWTKMGFAEVRKELKADICISSENGEIQLLTDEGQMRCFQADTKPKEIGQEVYRLLEEA